MRRKTGNMRIYSRKKKKKGRGEEGEEEEEEEEKAAEGGGGGGEILNQFVEKIEIIRLFSDTVLSNITIVHEFGARIKKNSLSFVLFKFEHILIHSRKI